MRDTTGLIPIVHHVNRDYTRGCGQVGGYIVRYLEPDQTNYDHRISVKLDGTPVKVTDFCDCGACGASWDGGDYAGQCWDWSTPGIDALRAALAPLLDDPWRYQGPERDTLCVFCDSMPHDAECPVLRKNELLGRVAGA